MSIRRVDIPSSGGGGIRCGKCLKEFKSWLRMKKHMADQHGQLNEFNTMDMSLTNRQSLRKERLRISEEALKDEISKLRNRR